MYGNPFVPEQGVYNQGTLYMYDLPVIVVSDFSCRGSVVEVVISFVYIQRENLGIIIIIIVIIIQIVVKSVFCKDILNVKIIETLGIVCLYEGNLNLHFFLNKYELAKTPYQFPVHLPIFVEQFRQHGGLNRTSVEQCRQHGGLGRTSVGVGLAFCIR